MKRCTKCGEWKKEGEYYPNYRYMDGLYSWCKKCFSEYNKKYRQDHTPKKILAEIAARKKEFDDQKRKRSAAIYWKQYNTSLTKRVDAKNVKRNRDRDRYYADIEYQREKNRRYRERNKDLIVARNWFYRRGINPSLVPWDVFQNQMELVKLNREIKAKQEALNG